MPATEAPAAPAAAPAAPATSQGSAARIEIPASSLTRPLTGAQPPPAKGSAKEKLQQSMNKRFGGEEAPVRPGNETTTEETETENVPRGTKPGEGETTTEPAETTTDPKEATNGAPADKGKGKVSPWKLVEELKTTRLRLEKELQDVRSQLVPEAERKSINEKLSTVEKRNKELEDEIRFVRYESSTEYKETYQVPYEKAWQRATKELSEITVAGVDGQPRAATPQDLLTIVQMPLGQARAVANEVFGDFANDMMQHRQQIRELAEKQQTALDEAKKNGSTREQERTQRFQRENEELSGWVKKQYEAENASVMGNEKLARFFKPREGDTEWNESLEQGYKFVDDTYNLPNVRDPKLTDDQRTSIVRRHAAVRNRAAGWKALRVEANRLEAKLKAAEAELAKYKGTTPSSEGRTSAPPVTAGQKGLAGMRSRLEKLAGPG